MNLKYKSQIEYLASKGVFLPDLYEPNGKDGYRFCFSEDKEKIIFQYIFKHLKGL